MMKPVTIFVGVVLLCGALSAQVASRPREAVLPASRPATEARYQRLGELPGVQGVVKFSDRFYRGAQPQDVEGMLSLKKLGVTTILSVEDPDAAEIEAAKKAGIDVINVATEYNGIPASVATDLVKKYREVEGTVYAHCHHGKHRGGAAGAILRMTFEGISAEEAVQEMAELGCSKRYAGLFDTVRAYRPDPALAHKVLKPRPGIDGLIEVTPWILRGTSTLSPDALAALKDLGVKSIISADVPADAAERARAAGFTVATLAVSTDKFDLASSQVVLAEFEKHKTERVFVHAGGSSAKAAALIAVFRIGVSRWTHDEAAREIEILVPGSEGAGLARVVRAFADPKIP
jgi:protein tyrosine phosphatase (PTP) superfamily phosphohydrolase (DUF442 family)